MFTACDCRTPQPKGLIDFQVPSYCSSKKKVAPFGVHYNLYSAFQQPFKFPGHLCEMWVDKKTVKGSFWAGAYDTTFSKGTIPVDESTCKKMVDFKLCGPDSNEMKTLGNVSSFI